MVIGHMVYYQLKFRLKKNGCHDGDVTYFQQVYMATLSG